ncbi:hypothetical protein [Actinomadura sp. KC216]|uniref:hypothetical protein n=1 Tax=Actinomadura sp. KC216 TaxID=2530370 RepID=UPI001404B6E2|nr:hypothetical protein [Actinomadura sp. KC216]
MGTSQALGRRPGIPDRIIQMNRDSEQEHLEVPDLLVRHLLGDRADRSLLAKSNIR